MSGSCHLRRESFLICSTLLMTTGWRPSLVTTKASFLVTMSRWERDERLFCLTMLTQGAWYCRFRRSCNSIQKADVRYWPIRSAYTHVSHRKRIWLVAVFIRFLGKGLWKPQYTPHTTFSSDITVDPTLSSGLLNERCTSSYGIFQKLFFAKSCYLDPTPFPCGMLRIPVATLHMTCSRRVGLD